MSYKYSVSMTQEEMEEIDELADKLGMSRSTLIRRAIAHYKTLSEVKSSIILWEESH